MYEKGALAKTVSFSTNPKLVDTLNSYCAERGCSRSWFLTQAVQNYLQECLENRDDYTTAAAALKAFESGNGKTYSTAELRKEFGL